MIKDQLTREYDHEDEEGRKEEKYRIQVAQTVADSLTQHIPIKMPQNQSIDNFL